MIQAPGLGTIKLFTAVFMNVHNKPSLMFMGKTLFIYNLDQKARVFAPCEHSQTNAI
jgi:hypothetical protein